MSLSFETCKKAAEALIDYTKTLEKQENENTKNKKTQLLTDYADEEHTIPLAAIDLVLTTKKFVADKKSMAPIQVPLSNAFVGKASSDAVPLSICILARDVTGIADSVEFYQKAIVEATTDKEEALTLLQAEREKHPLAENEDSKKPKKKGKKNSTQKAAKDKSIPLEELANVRVDRVVTFTQLRNEYKPFQARRQLISEHDIFFVDSALAEAEEGLLLPKILGKTFYNAAKTVPQPIQLTWSSNNDASKEKFVQLAIRNKDVGKKRKTNNSSDIKTREAALVEAVDADKIQTSFSLTKTLEGIYKRLHATHFMVAPSTQIIAKVGSTALTSEELAQNVADFVEFIVKTSGDKYLKHEWDSIRSIHLKTSTGPSLPIYMSKVLYENKATDVVADESELVDGKNKTTKKRGISEAKLTDQRIDELLTEIADKDEIDERLAKKPATTQASVNEEEEKKEEKEEKKPEEKPKAKAPAKKANGGKKQKVVKK